MNIRLSFRSPAVRRWTCLGAMLLFACLAVGGLAAQTASAVAGLVQGMVKSGNMPIPGATVTATNTLTGQKAVTWTDVNGEYVLPVPAKGRYVLRVQMPGFAVVTGEALVNAATPNPRADLEMVLSSRAPQPASEQQQARGTGAGNRGFQSLSMMQGEGTGDMGSGGEGDQVVPPGILVPGMSAGSATESVAYSGTSGPNFASMSSDEMRARMQEYRDQQGQGNDQRGQPGNPNSLGGPGGPPPGGGPPGGGPPGGGGGGFGGGPGIFFGGGRGRFDINRPHGMVYYSIGDSAFNASPYSLTGAPTTNPDYTQNRYGAAIGGPLNIPKIYRGGSKTFFFINYNGSHASNPFDSFSTVPTLAERGGDFSSTLISSGPDAGSPVQIFDPVTHKQFTGNKISHLNPAAAGLLKFIPLPNLPGVAQNFHFIESVSNNTNDLNVRVNRSLGAAAAGPRRGRGPRNNLTFGLHYHTSDSTLTNPFPTSGGSTSLRSIDVPVGYIRSFGKLTNIFRVDYNRNRISTHNLYAFNQDITGDLGIGGVSQNPFDWGLPNLSFTNFTSLQDTSPLLRRDQTISFSDSMVWSHGKHTWRWGGDFRRIELNTETDANARGSFVFTGFNSSEFVNGAPVPGTGFDFADFLLGLPQQTSVQFGINNYHFRGNSWDLFAQDEWKVRGNLTLNLGVRYEYVSPFSEINSRIVNLDLNSQFTAAVPVLPGQSGPFHGAYPDSLMHPDRNNFAPRLGIAWKAMPNTVVRAGYGINYNTTAYSTIAQQLAFQPPFSTTQTNVQSATTPLTLQQGFPAVQSGTITNNYAVDPNYRLGYVQIWNADVQQQFSRAVVLNLDYTGTKGTHLDIVDDPNRNLTGLRIPNVQPFLWEAALGDSTMHAGTVRLRKRLQKGISIGGSYTFSKSIDNASSIGGGANIVAQNAFELAAERGLSIFDQRHQFTADYLWELPFGHDKRWLAQPGILRDLLGDWQWSGNWTIASGLPFTPRILGNFADVSRGTNGTLRADVTGAPVSLPDPSVSEWFNTAAFTLPPTDQYGDARRNSIIGPPTRLFDMSLTKVFSLRENRMLEIRAQATNVFNTPQFASIDTTVNSPTYGRVISVDAMRVIQFTARFRF